MKAELSEDESVITITIPMNFRKRGGRKRIVAPAGMDSSPMPQRDDSLPKLVAKAHQWLKMLENGGISSMRAIAEQEKRDESYVAKVLRLTLLAPDIVQLILDGQQPDVLTWRELRQQFPVEWPKQREKWGIPEPA